MTARVLKPKLHKTYNYSIWEKLLNQLKEIHLDQ